MNILKITLITLVTLIIVSCGSSKKSTMPATLAKPSVVPGDAQLAAVKIRYPDATAEILSQGHSIYIGTCTNCHGQKNLYNPTEEAWLKDIDQMAPKSKLTAQEKDALTKYVLAMRAAPILAETK